MTDYRHAWCVVNLILGAVYVLTGYPPFQVIGSVVIVSCMFIPIATDTGVPL